MIFSRVFLHVKAGLIDMEVLQKMLELRLILF